MTPGTVAAAETVKAFTSSVYTTQLLKFYYHSDFIIGNVSRRLEIKKKKKNKRKISCLSTIMKHD